MEILKFEIKENKKAHITWRPFSPESTVFPLEEIEAPRELELPDVQLHPERYDLEWDGENHPRITRRVPDALEEQGWKEYYCTCGNHLGAIHLRNVINMLKVKGGGYFECSQCHQITTILEGPAPDREKLRALMTKLRRCTVATRGGFYSPSLQSGNDLTREILEIVRTWVGVEKFEYRIGF